MPISIPSRSRILVVDDDPGVRAMLCEFLGDDYDCVGANSAESALGMLAVEEFDLFLADIVMPGVSGLDLLPKVIERWADSVVVMMSGNQTIETAIEAMRLGAFDYIIKPFDLRQLEATIRRALEHRSLLLTKKHYELYLEDMVRQRTEQLDRLAYYDPLTGLPNKTLLKDRLNEAIDLALAHKGAIGVVAISLDRFRNINDTLGHDLGDQLLQLVAIRLEGHSQKGDTVATTAIDEFTIVATSTASRNELASIANDIQGVLRDPFDLSGHEVYVTASIGISVFPEDGEDSRTLVMNAGVSLERAKAAGGNTFRFFESDMNVRALKQLVMESNLRRALEREEFVIFYQPQVSATTGAIDGAEALIRWRHPELGMVAPIQFIALAEDTGLIVPIGEWVLRRSCAQKKAWENAGIGPGRISVNLSARQFAQADLRDMIASALADTGLDPRNLELELTESTIMGNPNLNVVTLREFKAMGIQIAIDDFGTGYSSLSYLKAFPIDRLKIDRSFIKDVTTQPEDAALVMAIINLAHNLNMKVVAEGVETDEQLRFLRLLRCDELQGYFLGRPAAAEDFENLFHAPESEAPVFA